LSELPAGKSGKGFSFQVYNYRALYKTLNLLGMQKGIKIGFDTQPKWIFMSESSTCNRFLAVIMFLLFIDELERLTYIAVNDVLEFKKAL
jgi:hypothetical protein